MTESARLFRFHRGSLARSMDTVVKVDDFGALLDAINEGTVIGPEATEANTVVRKYGEGVDLRIGWDTFIVLVDGKPVGFTNGMLCLT